MADSGFKARDKYPGFGKEKTLFYNSGRPVTGSSWTVQTAGTWFMRNNLVRQNLIIPIDGLRLGDKLKAFRIVGAIGGGATIHVTTAAATFETVTKGAGAVTTAIVATMSTVTSNTDVALDEETSLTEEIVATDYQYYVLIQGSSSASAASDLAITGIEVDIERA